MGVGAVLRLAKVGAAALGKGTRAAGNVAERAARPRTITRRGAGAAAPPPPRPSRPDAPAGGRGPRVSQPGGAGRGQRAAEALRTSAVPVGVATAAVLGGVGVAFLGQGVGEGARQALTPRVEIRRDELVLPQGAVSPELVAALLAGRTPAEAVAAPTGVGGLLGEVEPTTLILLLGLAAVVGIVILRGR